MLSNEMPLSIVGIVPIWWIYTLESLFNTKNRSNIKVIYSVYFEIEYVSIKASNSLHGQFYHSQQFND